MYRITEEVAKYLSENSKNPDIPGLLKTHHKPFVSRNIYSIGYINDALAFNTDALYLLELDVSTNGFFLYNRSELKIPNDTLEVPRSGLDPYTSNMEEMLNITDCAIELPPQTEKLIAKSIMSVKRLFELEPGIKKCLLDPKEKKNARRNTFGIF